ncbi:class I SAM-dependent methyltransferase [Actinomyces sp. Z5]|uniref:S-adenosyl-l-methionine-dependent methyltransferase n=1 Tax=Actinomyces glycerinitolerans TaxID=1892869 RepID=A0A1M4S3C1_9ACTO|nr:class I SAM-dependent methyltransferase [Actinomyces sp. Z5]RAX22577.1 class I SAM-dependent methyltransferase [Actinomyces sp. Z3]SHE26713.1 s-adenosyl-l-methionine-dependent methyltransferase [Actinomyces glycerinitolerans]
MTNVPRSLISAHRNPAETRARLLSLCDESEIQSVLDLLSFIQNPRLADMRVLELACGVGPVTLPMAAAGHRVLATDNREDVLGLFSGRMDGLRHTQPDVAARIEVCRADMTDFLFHEHFKAVCIPAGAITALDPEQRRNTIRLATAHLALGGRLILSAEHVRPEAPASTTFTTRPGITLTERIDHARHRRRITLAQGDQTRISERFLVAPHDLMRDFEDAGVTLDYRHFIPDTRRPHHTNIVFGTVKLH